MSHFEHYFQYIIPTGSEKLDLYFEGGLKTGSIVGLVGQTNSGLSTFAKSFAMNALRSKDKQDRSLNLKVLHIDLENHGYSSYIASLLNVKQSDSLDSQLNAVQSFKEQFEHRFKFVHNILTLNSLPVELHDIYSKFRFNVVVIDYPQLFVDFVDLQKTLSEIKSIATKFDCLIFCPIIINRNNASRVYTLSNIFCDIIMETKFEQGGLVSLTVLKKYRVKDNIKFSFVPDFESKSWIK